MSETGAAPWPLIIFDLDGVITTEHIYWECARLTVWELVEPCWWPGMEAILAIHDPATREAVIPLEAIFAIKNRAVNSNWDLTYLVGCALVTALPEGVGRGAQTAEALVERLRLAGQPAIRWPEPIARLLNLIPGVNGAVLLREVGRVAADHLGVGRAVTAPEGPLWQHLHNRFQGWYEGSLLDTHGAPRLQERPVLAPGVLRIALDWLRARGCRLGVATGRPLAEALSALQSFGLLDLFAVEHVVTHDDVLAAQEAMHMPALGKPHPFIIRRALWPGIEVRRLVTGEIPSAARLALVVGDSISDAQAARAAGVDCVGVLSGVSGETARQERAAALQSAGCLAILEDVSELPGWLDSYRGWQPR